MKYKILENNNIYGNIVEQVLMNRGIENPKQYLSLSESDVISFNMLENIDDATDLFFKHLNNEDRISILVDEDCDGFCSAAMMYSYIQDLYNDEYPVNYIMHKRAKAHGLTDEIDIPENTKLLIIPDAGTNDKEQLLELIKNGIDVIILDHHELEETYSASDLDNGKNRVVIVNNQMSDNYTNKALCGAGVVYKFLQALDAIVWEDYADNYLDLVALANISDVMDMRSCETKYLVDLGLKNIKNKLLIGFIEAQEFSMKGVVNIHNIQWYVSTLINGMVRYGSNEEKELMFKAFVEQDETFEYKKRATKDKPAETIQESIYDRVPRLCKNAKARQDKTKEKGVSELLDYIKDDDNKIILVDISETLDNALSGLVAIKIADMYKKPCVLLNKHYSKSLGKDVYGGSARNPNYSPIDNLKDVFNSLGLGTIGKGHASAFGIVDLECNKKDLFLEEVNKKLKDIVYDNTYRVDFSLDVEELDLGIISELTKFDDIIASGIEEPMIFLENISLGKNDFQIIGKTEDTIKFSINDIEYIMFKCKQGNELYDFIQDAWNDEDMVQFNIVGHAKWNDYEGIRKPQIQIVDVEVTNTSLSDDEDAAW